MEDVEEQILSYPQLSVAKQREVEAYVEDHPEWAPLLQDVRAIESLIRGVRTDEDPSEGFVTTYVVVNHFHPEEISEALQEAFRRLERRMETDEALRAQAEAARTRLREAEAAVDPVAQFEELTGHSLDQPTGAESPELAAASEQERSGNRRPASSRPSLVDVLLNLPRALRWGGAAIGLLLGAYVVLFGISKASESPLERMARVDVSDQIVENYTSTATRSAVRSADTVQADQLYIDGLSVLREARTSTLGLFPRYDRAKLARAEQQLTEVLDQTESGSFLALEAQFYLGKIYLAQSKVDAARSKFQIVVQREGRMADEARDILKRLRRMPASDTSGGAR